MPSGFVPEEDQGYVMVLIQAPPGASLDYTMNIVRQTEQTMMGLGQTKTMFAAGGFGFTGTSPNQGIVFAQLKDFKERRGEADSAKAIVGQLFGVSDQARRLCQDARRSAAVVGAGTSRSVSLDECDPRAELGRPQRSGDAGRSATDDREIERR